MIVKDLIDKLLYDSSKPFTFKINKISYNYYEVVSSKQLLDVYINKLEINGHLLELNSDDIIKVKMSNKDINDSDIELIIPNNTYYYSIYITIN